ncbi:MAG: alpha-glucosidase, partial [Alphaproteobacteria bacterium]|nr:alpha-glucosidase [Alphaproteobacteria bacterium]
MATKKHLNNEVIYQIYPLTFAYASGSQTDPYPSGAYGNLKGITSRVKYVESLGVDAIWITPFYKWGGNGFGYDMVDYCSVDRMYGDLDDFKELCETYHRHGIRVLIDQVYNHCS